MLIILDNVEEILNVDPMILKNFIDNLTTKVWEIKILMTSKTPVIQFLGNKVNEMKIGQLELRYAFELLQAKSGKIIPPKDRRALEKMKPEQASSNADSAIKHLFL